MSVEVEKAALTLSSIFRELNDCYTNNFNSVQSLRDILEDPDVITDLDYEFPQEETKSIKTLILLFEENKPAIEQSLLILHRYFRDDSDTSQFVFFEGEEVVVSLPTMIKHIGYMFQTN